MYDFKVALRRFQGLIRWTARHYAVQGDVRMDAEELEAEGYVTLVKCCQRYPAGQMQFARYFKRAWYNQLHHLRSFNLRKKRNGALVPLDERLAHFTLATPELLERKHQLKGLQAALSPQAWQLVSLLVEPTAEVYEQAYRDFCRRNHLKRHGQNVLHSGQCRVRLVHVRRAMGLTAAGAKELLLELDFVAKQNNNGGVPWQSLSL